MRRRGWVYFPVADAIFAPVSRAGSLSLSRLGVNILNLFIKSACVIRARECAPLHPFDKRANSAGHGREVLIFDMLIRRN